MLDESNLKYWQDGNKYVARRTLEAIKDEIKVGKTRISVIESAEDSSEEMEETLSPCNYSSQ